jgi:glucose-1-phosphate thymidylyltransferase
VKLVMPLYSLETLLAPDWSHPLGLQPVAGETLLDHMVASVRKWYTFTPVFSLNEEGRPLIDWWAGRYPEPRPDIFLTSTSNPIESLRRCRSAWIDDEIVLVTGDSVVDSNLDRLDQAEADVICLVHAATPGYARLKLTDGWITGLGDSGDQWTASGLWWFRNSEWLDRALDIPDLNGQPEPLTAGLIRRLGELNMPILARRAELVVPIDKNLTPAARLLAVNHRLLGFGHSSPEAIERSYGEDFTVLTPVYLAETAIIDSAVVGPYTTIAAGATVRGSVVRNSIIGTNAVVENAVLDGAVIGAGAIVSGRGRTVLVAEDKVWALEAG